MKKEPKKLKIYEILFMIISLGILILIGVTFKNNMNKNEEELKKHCEVAICNAEKTICYNYETNESGRTLKTWQGNCSTLKD